MPMIWLFVLLLAVTAFFNLAEMALVAVRGSSLAAAADPRADRALRLKQRPGLFLAAIRAGDLLTDLLTGAFVVTALEQVLGRMTEQLPVATGAAHAIATVAAFALISFLVLVFGDLAPKSIALAAPERSAMAVATPLRLFIVVARPFFVALEWSNAVVLRLFGITPGHEAGVSQAEIRRTLAEGLSTGALLGTERTMMERVLDLEQRSVRTVMTGRGAIQSIREDASAETIRQTALAASASRLLVLAATRDEPVGVVARADLLALDGTSPADLLALASPVHYVAERASVLGALASLKADAAGVAVVADEFGSMLGIVTLADVLEAIAGDIPSADPAAANCEIQGFRHEPDGSIVMPGAQPVDDLIEELGLAIAPDRGFKTIAGLVIERTRRLPRAGDHVAFDNFAVEIVAVDGGTISTVRVIPATGEQA